MIGVPDVPDSLSILLKHHKVVCQQLLSNAVSLGPRDVPLDSLDTRVAPADQVFAQAWSGRFTDKSGTGTSLDILGAAMD